MKEKFAFEKQTWKFFQLKRVSEILEHRFPYYDWAFALQPVFR
jgi:hypothetical protein